MHSAMGFTTVLDVDCWYVDRFPNIGIQCCKRHDVEESLKMREKIRVDPFGSEYGFNSDLVGKIFLSNRFLQYAVIF
jgi:Rel homology DNA-binding domain